MGRTYFKYLFTANFKQLLWTIAGNIIYPDFTNNLRTSGERIIFKDLRKKMVRFIILFAFIVMAGCATTGDEGDKKVDDRTGKDDKDMSTSTSTVTTSAMSDEERYSMKALNDPNSPLSIRTVYFAYDSSDITPESNDVLIEHARFLSINPGVKVLLEGHADERGTRGYNLALGERRAKSVHELFTTQGASMSQLEVVSYGEERPVAQEHDEAAWQLNRRVEILYPAN